MKTIPEKEEIDYEAMIEKQESTKNPEPIKLPEKKKELKITYGGVYVWE